MHILLQTIHILGAVFLILVVLLQSGRGGGMGATFGGAAGPIFGGRGASSFLTRVTTGAAIFFFVTSLALSMLSSQHRSVLQRAAPVSARAAAAEPAAPTPEPVPEPAATGDAPAPPADAKP